MGRQGWWGGGGGGGETYDMKMLFHECRSSQCLIVHRKTDAHYYETLHRSTQFIRIFGKCTQMADVRARKTNKYYLIPVHTIQFK